MPSIDSLTDELKTLRDEVRLKIHLGSRELQDQWGALEARFADFERKARLRESAKEVGEALEILGGELKEAISRVRKAV